MGYLFMALFVGIIVGLDQWTKFLTVQNIPLFGHMDAIDGLFSLTYTQNTGGAWSMMEGMIWLFVLIFILFTAGIVWEFINKKLGLTTFERWCVVAIFGGGFLTPRSRVKTCTLLKTATWIYRMYMSLR